MEDNTPATPPQWKRPDEVMRLHMLKKRRALAARMSRSSSSPSGLHDVSDNLNLTTGDCKPPPNKRNCFRRTTPSVKRSSDGTPVLAELDASSDNTLFHLLSSDSTPVPAANSTPTSFSSIFNSFNVDKRKTVAEASPKTKEAAQVPIDWTLRTKVRFMSPKPFPFNATLRTCEEASGITGFVRCVDTGQTTSSLDTSPNARLHQCCLIWQHPWLPWLDLYPRQAAKVSSTADANLNIAAMPALRDSLQRDWSKSFQSLFQLVRARQCPYFYVCANSFTCLFRAAGICGISETHALITPTTRGFRQLLKEEDVEFTLPLKKNSTKRKSVDSESGYETLDSVHSETSSQAGRKESVDNEEGQEDKEIEEDDVSNDKWLESMGIEAAEIRRLNTVQVQQKIDKERDIDKTPESLIMAEGVEAQALFNFLLNCKSCTATTGPLAGIPPTLLAPVAFHGSTLRPNKVRVSKVQVETTSYHSVELQGPVLPHAVLGLCDLLRPTCDQFSLTFANLETTKAFSDTMHAPALSNSPGQKENQSSSLAPCVFGQENLTDCGLSQDNLELFCSSDSNKVQTMESLKFSHGVYSWL
ncbi:Protein downstream neighbor of son-like protein [Frankliniella fusca]|uniref:Protein downstream neighbor of son-like protein n=1 Tax=Frankliniella fusca TaxID=407009 RepID=A0AAE1GQK0_9NEOP|nr:Protein downstream neighbor of son-like protein [Frankliniella fusca]